MELDTSRPIVSPEPPKEVRNELTDFEILELFQLVDADHGGTISRDEIAKLMKTLRYDASPEELDKMLNDIDLDHNGEIDPHEFISGFRRHGQMSIPPREIKAAFRVFAKHDGTINLYFLRDALVKYTLLPEPRTREHVEAITKCLFELGDPRFFNYKKFVDAQK